MSERDDRTTGTRKESGKVHFMNECVVGSADHSVSESQQQENKHYNRECGGHQYTVQFTI